MSVKKRDRHLSRSEPLNKSRVLVNYLLVLTRPAMVDDDGNKTKAGILGEGQPFYAFGHDLFKCAKMIHSKCYDAVQIYIKELEDFETRKVLFTEALRYCDSILRLVDLCIYQYARNNKKKMKSFMHLARLTKEQKDSIYERINIDGLILRHIHDKVH